jgi:PST family polysaccharide transporter
VSGIIDPSAKPAGSGRTKAVLTGGRSGNAGHTAAAAQAYRWQDYFRTDDLLVDLRGKALRGGAVTLVSQLAKLGLQIGSTSILARLLSPADYGLIAMAATIAGFVAVFKDMGLSAATVQQREIDHRQVSTLFWVNILTSAVLGVLTAATAPLIAWFYGEARLVPVTLALAAMFLLSGAATQHQALLVRRMRFAAIACAEITSSLISIMIGITLAWRGWGYWALVAMNATAGLALLVWVWVLCPWRPGPPVRYAGSRALVAFGGNLSVANFLNYVGGSADRVLIGYRFGSGPVGIYSKAYQLLLLPLTQINAPLGAVALPAMSRAVVNAERYRVAFLQTLEQVALITGPLAAIMIMCAEPIILIVLGGQWIEAAVILRVLGFAGILIPIWNAMGWLFVSQGRMREHLHFHAVDFVFKVLSVVAGLPWGIRGVAVGVAVRYSVELPILFWIAGSNGPVRTGDLYRAMALPALVSACCMGAVFVLQSMLPAPWGVLALLLSCVAAALTWALVLVMSGHGRQSLRGFVLKLRGTVRSL